ncbi:DUF4258 domain-containing protein [Shumkonia mesophila]|uniref:DUF4258 domain-containing protein n=1 Tax=Shumkonia mesophila TaxID=2838854 RepID=UPI002934A006|nr:DUF4258 domain-containing protein [Shumkonia mesophila]
MSAEVLPLRLTAAMATKIAREIASDTGRVAFSSHARSQMRKRGINATQVYRCLRAGVLAEGPYVDIHGYWRCAFETLTAGDSIKAVVAFNSRELLIVVTAI